MLLRRGRTIYNTKAVCYHFHAKTVSSKNKIRQNPSNTKHKTISYTNFKYKIVRKDLVLSTILQQMDYSVEVQYKRVVLSSYQIAEF